MEEEEDFLSPWKEKEREGKGEVGGARETGLEGRQEVRKERRNRKKQATNSQ